MKTNKSKIMPIRLEPALYDRLLRVGKKQGQTVSEIVRSLIIKYLKP